MPRGPSEILLYLICRKFLLSAEPLVKNEGEMVMLPVMEGEHCVLSPVCLVSLGAAAVERHCLATSLSPPSEGDSCAGGQKTFGFR